MNYDVSIKEENGILKVIAKGNRTMVDSKALWDLNIQKIKERKLSKLLVTLDLVGNLSISDYYTLATHATDLIKGLNIKIAVVDLNNQSIKDNSFAETVAMNRGMNVLVFESPEAAEQWLKRQ